MGIRGEITPHLFRNGEEMEKQWRSNRMTITHLINLSHVYLVYCYQLSYHGKFQGAWLPRCGGLIRVMYTISTSPEERDNRDIPEKAHSMPLP